MKYYPAFLDIKGKNALVIGGGVVALRKVETLLECGAVVSIISRELNEELNRLVKERRVRHKGKRFRDEELEGMFIVIAATDEGELNHRISQTAQKKGLLVNVVDQPADCNFIVPSIVKRGDLLIAISTSGKSPALARRLRKELETQFTDEYGLYLELMGRLRERVLKGSDLCLNERSDMFKYLSESRLFDLICKRDLKEVKSLLRGIVPEYIDSDGIVDEIIKGR